MRKDVKFQDYGICPFMGPILDNVTVSTPCFDSGYLLTKKYNHFKKNEAELQHIIIEMSKKKKKEYL